MRLLMSVLVLAVTASGCSGSVDPQLLDGVWSQDFVVAGSGQDMTLSLSGSNVSGTGSWCGEAIGCATTTVAGTISMNKVHLVTTFSNGRVQTFDGHLVSANSLTGSTVENSAAGMQLPYAQSFHRAANDVIPL
jgi:hypothetical protein